MNPYEITTAYDPAPIPLRGFDWSAWIGDMDEGISIGHGSTEREAINNLIDMMELESEK